MNYKSFVFIIATIFISHSLYAQFGSFGRSPNKKKRALYEKSKHFKEGRFVNEVHTEVMVVPFKQVIKDQRASKHVEKTPNGTIPVRQLQSSEFSGKSDSLKFWWLGHSTVILELDQKRILIDPVLCKRAAPFQWIGPKRYHPAPIKAEDLPQVDAILISHDHYDHLDYKTVKKIAKRNIKWHVPLGVGAHLEKWGVHDSNIIEMDWWQEKSLGSLKIVATPARHFSGRGMFDKAKAFWASWTVIGQKQRFYYSGDTGLSEHFKNIGNKYGPFDLSIIQIGAYNKNWPYIHMFPEEAITALNMLKSKTILPVHWGTFNLAMHKWDEPVERLIKGADKTMTIISPIPGEMVSFSRSLPQERWWRKVVKLPKESN